VIGFLSGAFIIHLFACWDFSLVMVILSNNKLES